MNKDKKNYADAFFKSNKQEIRELNYKCGDTEVTIRVYPTIPFINRTKMVNEIYQGVFMGGKNTTEDYVPEYLNFLRMYYTIKYFTDFELPENLEDAWALLSATNLYYDVYHALGMTLQTIFDEADNKIETRRLYLSNRSDINSMISKIAEKIDSMNMNVSPDDVSKIVDVLSNLGAIQPDTLVQSIVKNQNTQKKKTSAK